MKKITSLLALFVLATTFTFCTVPSLDDPLEFGLVSDITQSFPLAITANESGECINFSETSPFDLKSNSQISENYSRVNGIRINSLYWEVVDYVGDEGVFLNSGVLKIGNTSFDMGKVDLKASDVADAKFLFSDTAKLSAIAQEILPTGLVTVTIEAVSGGNCDNDFSFNLSITANVIVTVSPA
jgi:hypothetical protein